jgi:hypothetical protein
LSHPFRLFFGVGVLLATTAVAAPHLKLHHSQEEMDKTDAEKLLRTTEADKPTTDKQASDQINTNKAFQYTSRQCRTEESCATGKKQTTECRSRKKSNNRMQIQKKEIKPQIQTKEEIKPQNTDQKKETKPQNERRVN